MIRRRIWTRRGVGAPSRDDHDESASAHDLPGRIAVLDDGVVGDRVATAVQALGLVVVRAHRTDDVDEVVERLAADDVGAIHPGASPTGNELETAAAHAGMRLLRSGDPLERTAGSRPCSIRTTAGQARAAVSDGDHFPIVVHGGDVVVTVRDAMVFERVVRRIRREHGDDASVTLTAATASWRRVEQVVLADRSGATRVLGDQDVTIAANGRARYMEAPAPGLPDTARDATAREAARRVDSAGTTGIVRVTFEVHPDGDRWQLASCVPGLDEIDAVVGRQLGLDLTVADLLAHGGLPLDRVLDEASVPDGDRAHVVGVRIVATDAPSTERVVVCQLPAGADVWSESSGPSAPTGGALAMIVGGAADRIAAIGVTATAVRDTLVRGRASDQRAILDLLGRPEVRAGRLGRDLATGRTEPPSIDGLLRFVAERSVAPSDGPVVRARPAPPRAPSADPPAPGTKQRLDALGPEAFATWMRQERRLLVTDTTLRDAHQSLLATRVRTHDLVASAPAFAHGLPQLLSLECWGGATFDVAMRFLHEDPWERLATLRASVPNILLQMLLRGSSAVGYTRYPDRVVRFFVEEAARTGVDVFRVFDSLNLVDDLRVAIEAVREAGALCEGTLCYTADLHDPSRPGYDLAYYVDLARRLEHAGCHVLAIKDMAGVCRPPAAAELVRVLREEVGLPVHLHTHDTSGFAAATVYATAEAGVDAVDAAVDAMSGLTSQPSLGSLVRALEHTDRSTGLDPTAITRLSTYWEQVRQVYAPFESDIRAGTSDVYRHEMPGGQYTNLRQQARAVGLGDERWPEVADAYATANQLLGDIVKVTPSSKVVGDLALTMVAAGLDGEALVAPDVEVSFPDSVIGLIRGDLGVPPGGFPDPIARKVRAASRSREVATTGRDDPDLDQALTVNGSRRDAASSLMYPTVHADHVEFRHRYGDVSVLPTDVFLHGLEVGTEVTVTTAEGRSVTIGCSHIGERRDDGTAPVLLTVDGVGRTLRVAAPSGHRSRNESGPDQEADTGTVPSGPGDVLATMNATVTAVHVEVGQVVEAGDVLATLEAMKMEVAVNAPDAGTVELIDVNAGTTVTAGDRLLVVT